MSVFEAPQDCGFDVLPPMSLISPTGVPSCFTPRMQQGPIGLDIAIEGKSEGFWKKRGIEA
jgi:hypothetical protein